VLIHWIYLPTTEGLPPFETDVHEGVASFAEKLVFDALTET